MSLTGELQTMSLTDLLQWLGAAGKTGVLKITHERITKWIVMSEGRIVGCSSDDPPQRLGQYLLSREKITPEQLRQGLAVQEQKRQHLGRILVEMGAITAEDLAGHLESKAEETIYSLFDWDQGVFRFDTGIEQEDNSFPVDLRVDDVLLRGLKRYDEMRRIRQVLHDPGLVLRYTEKPPGPEIFANKMARTMYSAIDGDRTVADILLQVHGSDYIVFKFLYELHRNGYVEISGNKTPVDAPTSTTAVPEVAAVAAATPSPVPAPTMPVAQPRATAVAEPAPPTAVPVAKPSPTVTPTPGPLDADSKLAEARRLMDSGNSDAALEILEVLHRENPGDDALGRLTADAEAVFVEQAYRHFVQPDKVPILTRPIDSMVSESLSPHEFFLLSRIDGSWDIKSIIQVAPLREVDALRTLKRMRGLGMIELHDPQE